MWNLIAAADVNWGIGRDNRLLVQIPRDMQQFRERTMGQIVVMGRRTLESLPNAMALYGRENVVLSAGNPSVYKGVLIKNDIDSLRKYLDAQEREVYVIGGESVYRQLLPYCDTAYITKIDHTYEADAYMPNLEQAQDWELAEESEEQTYFDIEYTFQVYRRRERSNG